MTAQKDPTKSGSQNLLRIGLGALMLLAIVAAAICCLFTLLLLRMDPVLIPQHYSVDWSPDGNQVVVGSNLGVFVYTISTQHSEFLLEDDYVTSAKWSPDGELIAVAHDMISIIDDC